MSKGNRRNSSFLSKHSSKLTIGFVLSVMFVGMIHLVPDKKENFPSCVDTPEVLTTVYDNIYSTQEKSYGDVKNIDVKLIEEKLLKEGLKQCSVKAAVTLKDDSILMLNIEYVVSWLNEENNIILTTITSID